MFFNTLFTTSKRVALDHTSFAIGFVYFLEKYILIVGTLYFFCYAVRYMAARSRTKKTSTKTAKKTSSPGFEGMSLSQARRTLEASYSLHLILLLIMTVLSGLLLWIVVKQQYTIDSLDFQLRFVRDRYEWSRNWNGELLESKVNGEYAIDEEGNPIEVPDGMGDGTSENFFQE